MKITRLQLVALPALVLALPILAALAAPAELPPSGVQLRGAVSHPGALDNALIQGLPTYRRLIKVAGSDGKYRCALEVEGYALRDILDRAEVKKKVDDGFNRPLDTLIVVRGRAHTQALFSYGEVFLAPDGGPLLADRARFVLPGHHAPLKAETNDPTVLRSGEERGRLSLQSCASCHAGPEPPALSLPKGWLLTAPQDGFGGRFVEDVAEIAVQQVGVPAKKEASASATTVVDSPVLVAPDGAQTKLTPERFQQTAGQDWKDATFGEGRGFRGYFNWQGADLEGVLRPLLPAGVNPREVWVLVTAADGYRSVYSGSEVFAAPADRRVLLVDRANGAPLGAGSGRYMVVPKADFYADRGVRLVKEIRIGLMSPPG